MSNGDELCQILKQLERVFTDQATTLACGHMLSYEVGSQLQRHKIAWDHERRKIETTIEQEMEKSFLISPMKAQETTLRHQKIIESFLRDIEDRRMAVSRSCRKTFLNWLKAAGGDDESSNSPSSNNNNNNNNNILLQQSQLLPIDFGRGHTSSEEEIVVKFPIFGCSSHEKISMKISLSTCDQLQHFLPLIHSVTEGDHAESRESAMRAIGMLSRFFHRHCHQLDSKSLTLPGSATNSNAILLFCGGTVHNLESEFKSICLDPIRDFLFDIFEFSSSNEERPTMKMKMSPQLQNFSTSQPINQDQQQQTHEPKMKIFPVDGVWGANVGVMVASASNFDDKNANKNAAASSPSHFTFKFMIQEIIDHCVSMWSASMISVVFSNSLSSAECCEFATAIGESIKQTSQDCYTSMRVSTRNGVKIAASTQNNNNNNDINTSSSSSISSPLGCTVRFFIPKLKLQIINNALRKQLLE